MQLTINMLTTNNKLPAPSSGDVSPNKNPQPSGSTAAFSAPSPSDGASVSAVDVAAMRDVETWLGWTRSALSSPTSTHAIHFVKAVLRSLGIDDPVQLRGKVDTNMLGAIAARLDREKGASPPGPSGPPAIDEAKIDVLSSLYELLHEEARQMASAAASKLAEDGQQSKFGELVLGEADAFFSGLPSLIGPPNHLDLEGAVLREHCSKVREFTTSNYGVTTDPRKEYELVFGTNDGVATELSAMSDAVRKAKVHPKSGEDGTLEALLARTEPEVPRTRRHIPLVGLLASPQQSLLAMKTRYAQLQDELSRVDSGAESLSAKGPDDVVRAAKEKVEQRIHDLDALMKNITAVSLKEVGLTELELGCLRLYTGELPFQARLSVPVIRMGMGLLAAGPMFQEYNSVLRNLGDTAFRGASVEARPAGGEATFCVEQPGSAVVRIVVDRAVSAGRRRVRVVSGSSVWEGPWQSLQRLTPSDEALEALEVRDIAVTGSMRILVI